MSQDPARPAAATTALAALLVVISLVVVSVAQLVTSGVGGATAQTYLIVIALGAGIGAAPALIALFALWRGRSWAPVVVTVAGAWASILVLQAESWTSWTVLAASVVAAVASWSPPARTYARQVRESEQSGLK